MSTSKDRASDDAVRAARAALVWFHEQGITAATIAKEIGRSPQAVYLWRTGARRPGRAVCTMLCDFQEEKRAPDGGSLGWRRDTHTFRLWLPESLFGAIDAILADCRKDMSDDEAPIGRSNVVQHLIEQALESDAALLDRLRARATAAPELVWDEAPAEAEAAQ